MHGLMMDYPLTLDRILEHANRMYPHKTVKTKLPDGSFHEYTYGDFYKRVKRLANALVGLGVQVGDRVRVKRAGDVIPYVIGPVPGARTGAEQPYTLPAVCPSCGEPVVNPAMFYQKLSCGVHRGYRQEL